MIDTAWLKELNQLNYSKMTPNNFPTTPINNISNIRVLEVPSIYTIPDKVKQSYLNRGVHLVRKSLVQ